MAAHPRPIETAVRLAAQGFRLFPLRVGGDRKSPRPGFMGWDKENASSDEATLRKWDRQTPGCNFGVSCGPSGLVVVDVDMGGDKAGHQTIAQHKQEGNALPPTYAVKTPGGGWHFYYKGSCPSKNGREGIGLGVNVDVKSDHGYVVAPGGVSADGKLYKEVSAQPVQPAPAWVVSAIEARLEPAGVEADPEDLDHPVAVRAAVRYLREDAPPARVGHGRDDTTYMVAAQVRDFGLTLEKATGLMRRHYPVPGWDDERLTAKVEHAYRYAVNPLGSQLASTIFKDLDPIVPETPIDYEPSEPRQNKEVDEWFQCAGDLDIASIPARQWLLYNRFIPKYFTVTIAKPGVGKSSLALVEALSVITGEACTHRPVSATGAAWWYSEDPIDEMARRIAAMKVHYQVPRESMRQLHYTSHRQHEFKFVSATAGGVVVHDENIDACIDKIQKWGIKLFIVDPAVMTYDFSENDNAAMGRLANSLHTIAEATGCAINLIHHDRKSVPGGGSTAGDMDRGRGASSLMGATREAWTMDPMGEKEAAELGIETEERRSYVQATNAKSNMTKGSYLGEWYKLVSVTLPNGDDVGVAEKTTLEKGDDYETKHNELLAFLVQEVGVGERSIHDVARAVGRREVNDRQAVLQGRTIHTFEVWLYDEFSARPQKHGKYKISAYRDETGQRGSGALLRVEVDPDYMT